MRPDNSRRVEKHSNISMQIGPIGSFALFHAARVITAFSKQTPNYEVVPIIGNTYGFGPGGRPLEWTAGISGSHSSF